MYLNREEFIANEPLTTYFVTPSAHYSVNPKESNPPVTRGLTLSTSPEMRSSL